MITDDILTPRLRLVALTPELIDADSTDPQLLVPLLNAIVPTQWPPEHWEPHVFDFFRNLYATQPDALAWNRYVLTRGEQPTLIGTLGGFPRSAEEAEVGYGILHPWQRRGFATEGLKAMLEHIFGESGIASVIAHTFPHLTPSLRVLDKCSFQPDGAGDEQGTLRFRLQRPL